MMMRMNTESRSGMEEEYEARKLDKGSIRYGWSTMVRRCESFVVRWSCVVV
jgi:hypothetical protein